MKIDSTQHHRQCGGIHFGHHRAHIGHAVLAGTRNRTNAPTEEHDRCDHQRDADQQPKRERRREIEQQQRAPDCSQRVAQRDRNRGANHLLDDRGIAGACVSAFSARIGDGRSVYEDGKNRVHPFVVPKLMNNAAASHVSMEHNLKGPSFTVSTACASSMRP